MHLVALSLLLWTTTAGEPNAPVFALAEDRVITAEN